MAIKEKLLAANHPRIAASHGYIADILANIGHLDLAMNHYQIQLESLPEDHIDIGSCYHAMGIIFYKQGDYQQAMNMLEKGTAINIKSTPITDPYMIDVKRTLKCVQIAKTILD